jgi:prepilin-type N-terminal cleavage/methylation domain-containing protein
MRDIFQQRRRDIRSESEQGFSLLELLISVLIFLVIITITFSVLISGLLTSKKEFTVAYYDEAIKSAMALMMTEIQQAGSHPDSIPAPRVRTTVVSGLQDVSLLSVDGENPLRGINVGDKVTIYDDPTKFLVSEVVDVISINPDTNSFKANLFKMHPADSLVSSIKQPFRTGILPNSTAERLKFFGDIYDDGQLYYVEYTYDKDNQRLLRSIRVADGVPAVGSSEEVKFIDRTLLRNVLNPSGTPIFQYIADDQKNIVSVIITLTVGTGDFLDQRLLTLTSTVTARNVVAASTLTRTKDLTASRLPPTPQWITFISTRR